MHTVVTSHLKFCFLWFLLHTVNCNLKIENTIESFQRKRENRDHILLPYTAVLFLFYWQLVLIAYCPGF